jgi:hypothetical protein
LAPVTKTVFSAIFITIPFQVIGLIEAVIHSMLFPKEAA